MPGLHCARQPGGKGGRAGSAKKGEFMVSSPTIGRRARATRRFVPIVMLLAVAGIVLATAPRIQANSLQQIGTAAISPILINFTGAN